MDAQVGSIRSQGSTPSQTGTRRGAEFLLVMAGRSAGAAEPVPRRQAVQPVFRRPSLEPPTRRPATAPALGPSDGASTRAAEPAPPRPPAAPPFELQHFELVPANAPPNPRGYAVYSQQHRPVPAPVVLIDTAA